MLKEGTSKQLCIGYNTIQNIYSIRKKEEEKKVA
jgi:hypothetical protein